MKFTYSFDELEIIKNYAVMAAGEVDVDYHVSVMRAMSATVIFFASRLPASFGFRPVR